MHCTMPLLKWLRRAHVHHHWGDLEGGGRHRSSDSGGLHSSDVCRLLRFEQRGQEPSEQRADVALVNDKVGV